ncbi:MAG: type II secretion system minor pseudopilin GspK [Burkholderiales bacterium]|nr:type II secretion system minor pseudopilin GspK [Burkholderiales bacterium]MDE2627579.1 type II secretion system minor pseudopilin GspK [Burkholderiales bacterium]
MRRTTLRHRSTHRQRGAALLTAMIIVTLVATLAASMVWQQWRAVQVESAERAREQAAWILSGALDFARLILREDLRSDKVTALTEPWATPLAEARLSTFLAVDKANAGDAPEAFLSGHIDDAQARYNLMDLVSQGKVDPLEVETLQRLCLAVGVESGVAQTIANGLLEATAPPTAATGGGGATATAPLLPRTLAQLSWLGVDAPSLKALRPYVVLLPVATPVNVNTASREVLAAVMNVDLASAERLVQSRQRNPFQTPQAATALVVTAAPANAKLDVRSSFFEVHGRLRLADHVLVENSLVQRLPNGQVNVLRRERVASLDAGGP